MTAAKTASDAAPATNVHALAPFEGRRPPAPDWFTAAIAAHKETGRVSVDGADIAVCAWGERGRPALVFVHGGLAQAGWWDFIAPHFADEWRVIALSLSGHGDSGWRDEYSLERHAQEVVAAAEWGGAFESETSPVIVGHSFGGITTMVVASEHGARFGGVVIVDVPRIKWKRSETAPRRAGGRVYATETQALARFRLVPAQECENLFAVDHVARTALRAAKDENGAEGFTWAHDPDFWIKFRRRAGSPYGLAPELACAMAIMRGADSALISDELWREMTDVLGSGVPALTIEGAAHHVMLDQPVAFCQTLSTFFRTWPPAGKVT